MCVLSSKCIQVYFGVIMKNSPIQMTHDSLLIVLLKFSNHKPFHVKVIMINKLAEVHIINTYL